MSLGFHSGFSSRTQKISQVFDRASGNLEDCWVAQLLREVDGAQAVEGMGGVQEPFGYPHLLDASGHMSHSLFFSVGKTLCTWRAKRANFSMKTQVMEAAHSALAMSVIETPRAFFCA